MRIDKDDNVWAADKSSDLVITFNPAGRVTQVFGRSVFPTINRRTLG
ncbi:MAG: hypothetical protein ACRD2N_07465 [Vicinamibacterales bacterium]